MGEVMLGSATFRNFFGVQKFKSVNRAIRRGKVLEDGTIVPKRPYNNRGNTCQRENAHSRIFNEYKKYHVHMMKKAILEEEMKKKDRQKNGIFKTHKQ